MVNIKKSKVENGITVISEGIESVRSISVGFWIVVGSRNERKEEKGTAHFLEHTLFKGTKKRSVTEIARALESKGASIDAFTSKEISCYYSRGLASHLRLSTDVISDLVTNPRFPREELKKEIGVVIEEIQSTIDTPEKFVFDLLFKKVFNRHPLAHSIVGKKGDIAGITRKRVISFFKKWYVPERIVVTASGYLKHNDLVEHVKRYCKPQYRYSHEMLFTAAPFHYSPTTYTYRKKGLLQSHLIIVTPTFNYTDPLRYPLLVLDIILGDGMSSILFVKVREEKALVYEIFSFADFYSDAGIFGIYLACDKTKIKKAQETVLKELRKLKKKGVSQKAVREAKVRLKAKLLMGQESTFNRMVRLGRSEIYRRKVTTIDEIITSINKVKTSQVNDLAKDILRGDRFSFIYMGDL